MSTLTQEKIDNAVTDVGNIETFVNNPAGTFTTRLGRTAKTMAQIEEDAVVNAKSYVASSTTSLVTAGTGTKTFATQSNRAYTVGARARATSVGTGQWMEGVVSSYSGTSLAIVMDRNSGTGTHADWNINVAGEPGAAGAGTGDMLAANNGSDFASAGTVRTNLGLAIGSDVQAYSAKAAAIAALTWAADKFMYFTGTGAVATTDLTTFARSLLTTTSAATLASLLGWRVQLAADTTFYVRTDGSNSNNGAANTSGGAWVTITYAVAWVKKNVDLRGYNVTIQVGDGTYTESVTIFGRFVGARDTSDGVDITLQGNTSSPGNVIWQTASGNCLTCIASSVAVNGFKLQRSSGSPNGFFAEKNGFIHFYNMIFHDFTGGYHIVVTEGGHVYFDGGTYAITGNAVAHIIVQGNAESIIQSVVVAVSAITVTSFLDLLGPCWVQMSCTFGGAGANTGTTGKKHDVKGTATLSLGPAAATEPGATAGTVDGGQVR